MRFGPMREEVSMLALPRERKETRPPSAVRNVRLATRSSRRAFVFLPAASGWLPESVSPQRPTRATLLGMSMLDLPASNACVRVLRRARLVE